MPITLFLYLLTQQDKRGYDIFTRMVVIAASKQDARKMHPLAVGENAKNIDLYWIREAKPRELIEGTGPGTEYPAEYYGFEGVWANSPETVACEFLGTAKKGETTRVVLTHFTYG